MPGASRTPSQTGYQMPTLAPCLSFASQRPATVPDGLHEIKYDGYRFRLERDGDRVRLFTRNGYDWTKRGG
jgi:ATP-dependent DNA ligase